MLHIHYICSTALESVPETHSISRSLLLKLLKFLKLLTDCNFLHIHVNNNRTPHETFQSLEKISNLTLRTNFFDRNTRKMQVNLTNQAELPSCGQSRRTYSNAVLAFLRSEGLRRMADTSETILPQSR